MFQVGHGKTSTERFVDCTNNTYTMYRSRPRPGHKHRPSTDQAQAAAPTHNAEPILPEPHGKGRSRSTRQILLDLLALWRGGGGFRLQDNLIMEIRLVQECRPGGGDALWWCMVVNGGQRLPYSRV